MYFTLLFRIALKIKIIEGGHGKDCEKGVEDMWWWGGGGGGGRQQLEINMNCQRGYKMAQARGK